MLLFFPTVYQCYDESGRKCVRKEKGDSKPENRKRPGFKEERKSFKINAENGPGEENARLLSDFESYQICHESKRKLIPRPERIYRM